MLFEGFKDFQWLYYCVTFYLHATPVVFSLCSHTVAVIYLSGGVMETGHRLSGSWHFLYIQGSGDEMPVTEHSQQLGESGKETENLIWKSD